MPSLQPTPVALFVYNRPDVTVQVFDAIRTFRPRRLFVIADGPLQHRGDDEAQTTLARQMTEEVDWPCDVHRDYAPANMGIKKRMESGMRLLFDEAGCSSAILLEDDCVPEPSFFPFCEELLERYHEAAAVAAVCGARLTAPQPTRRFSYAFTRYPCQWGWATWRRAWQRYDGTMAGWDERRTTTWLSELLDNRHAEAYWRYQFDRVKDAGDGGDWDIAWLLASWIDGALSVVPAANLVSNIGFSADATHTRDTRSAFASLPAVPMRFPLRHPPAIERSDADDRLTASTVFSGNLERLVTSLRQRIRRSVAE
jgi:hypothetical protein